MHCSGNVQSRRRVTVHHSWIASKAKMHVKEHKVYRLPVLNKINRQSLFEKSATEILVYNLLAMSQKPAGIGRYNDQVL